jgi:hypothetical protein
MSDAFGKGLVISLCDRTGHFVEPWIRFGYTALLVDPQHEDYGDYPIYKAPGTILEAMPFISLALLSNQVKFVMGFPPCTDVALSGAKWWEDKRRADPYFQAKATMVAEQCRMVGLAAGCPGAFENPMSAFSKIFGPPDYKFHPYDYSGYCEDDQYFKTTWLWTGGGFIMPPTRQTCIYGEPDQRIFEAGESVEGGRANFRSATPKGFSRAVFLANAPEFKGQILIAK